MLYVPPTAADHHRQGAARAEGAAAAHADGRDSKRHQPALGGPHGGPVDARAVGGAAGRRPGGVRGAGVVRRMPFNDVFKFPIQFVSDARVVG